VKASAARLLLLAAALPAASLAAPEEATKEPDCPGLAALPYASGSREDRRITCDIPGPLRLQVQQSEERGLRLRRHDLAASLSSDALKHLHAFEHPPGKPAGWLTKEIEGGIQVRYFIDTEAGPRAFASAVLDDASNGIRDARLLDTAEPADEHELRQLKARTVALQAPRLDCTSSTNTIVLEEPGSDSIRVYAFSAWDEKAAPMGGHSRFLVSSDGSTLLDSFQQTDDCLNLAPKADPRGMILVSDRHEGPPSELQLFLQRQYEVPVVVHMHGDDSVWKVQDGLLYLLPPGDPLHDSVIQGEQRAADEESK
jgi:hypothetical protein